MLFGSEARSALAGQERCGLASRINRVDFDKGAQDSPPRLVAGLSMRPDGQIPTDCSDRVVH